MRFFPVLLLDLGILGSFCWRHRDASTEGKFIGHPHLAIHLPPNMVLETLGRLLLNA